jgi:hypothetical protein
MVMTWTTLVAFEAGHTGPALALSKRVALQVLGSSRVAIAAYAAPVRMQPVEAIQTAFTVHAVRVVLAVDTMATVARLFIQGLIEKALVRHAYENATHVLIIHV